MPLPYGHGSEASGLSQNRFHLPQMIQIVATHGLDHYPQCHIAAFGMIQGLVEILGREPRDQREIPLANRGECGERRVSVIARISYGPVVLIERLDDMVVLSQSLPQPERKHKLAVGEVAEYVANAPFAWSRRAVEHVITARREKIIEPVRRGPSYCKRIPVSQLRCVGICRHIT